MVLQQLVGHPRLGIGMQVTTQLQRAPFARKALHDIILCRLGKQVIQRTGFDLAIGAPTESAVRFSGDFSLFPEGVVTAS